MNEETVDEVLSLFRKAEADIEIASDMMPKVDGRQHDNIAPSTSESGDECYPWK